jgi:aminoglycoside phosphotransferase (APT) family kinase protein
VAEQVDPGAGLADVQQVRRLPGATSSVLHEVVVAPPSGPARSVVLRRYVVTEWAEAGPELVQQEADALAAASSAPVAVPGLVACDLEGSRTGTPSLLMTKLPGRPTMADGDAWIDGLAEVHRMIATWEPANGAALPAFEPWLPLDPSPPTWSRHRGAWAYAIERVMGELPPSAWPHRPIHRDLHPANILFRRGRPSGVVDWVNASIGPVESDLSRCRFNLTALAGAAAAERFLAATGPLGARYDPAWDLLVPVEMLPSPDPLLTATAFGGRLDQQQARQAVDDLVARTVATLR